MFCIFGSWSVMCRCISVGCVFSFEMKFTTAHFFCIQIKLQQLLSAIIFFTCLHKSGLRCQRMLKIFQLKLIKSEVNNKVFKDSRLVLENQHLFPHISTLVNIFYDNASTRVWVILWYVYICYFQNEIFKLLKQIVGRPFDISWSLRLLSEYK